LPDPFDFEGDRKRALFFAPMRHAAILKFFHSGKKEQELRKSRDL
jgi:hypothetical protein